MATNRKRIPRSRVAAVELSPALLHYFRYGFSNGSIRNLEGAGEALGLIFFDGEREKLFAAWHEHRGQIIADWAKEHPGTLPYFCSREAAI
jgi:hypothetical protein